MRNDIKYQEPSHGGWGSERKLGKNLTKREEKMQKFDKRMAHECHCAMKYNEKNPKYLKDKGYMQKRRAFEDPGIVIFYFAQHLESVDTPWNRQASPGREKKGGAG